MRVNTLANVDFCSWTDVRIHRTMCGPVRTKLSKNRHFEISEVRRFAGTSSAGTQRDTLGVSTVPDHAAASTRLRAQTASTMHLSTSAAQVMLLFGRCRCISFHLTITLYRMGQKMRPLRLKADIDTDGRTSPASSVCNKPDAATSCVSNKLINSGLVNSLNADAAMLPDTNDFCL